MDEMNERQEHRPDGMPRSSAASETDAVADADPGHPSQAEGEDPAREDVHPDPALHGHPSQAEGEDREEQTDG